MIYKGYMVHFFKQTDQEFINDFLEKTRFIVEDCYEISNRVLQISVYYGLIDDLNEIINNLDTSKFKIIDDKHILYKLFNVLPEEKTIDILLDEITENGYDSLKDRDKILLIRLSELI